ncbi:MAG: glutathione S-transferase [Sandaracinaceae bacterium]|jgi:glutathione S-transferase|nr:glutathione S-transferase [Sandaracinaceae bacterium]
MITLHHLERSRSQRVLWLLEELGIPYEIKIYARHPSTSRAPAELRAVHPLGKSPVITDGETTVAESAVIIEYLLDKYGQGRLRPVAGTPEHQRYVYWLHFAEGSAMAPLLVGLIFARLETAKLPFFVKPIVKKICAGVRDAYIQPQLDSMFGYANTALERQPWFCGDEFTAADIQMSYPVEAAVTRAGLGTKYVKLTAFVERIHAMPSYQRAVARGGPAMLDAL